MFWSRQPAHGAECRSRRRAASAICPLKSLRLRACGSRRDIQPLALELKLSKPFSGQAMSSRTEVSGEVPAKAPTHRSRLPTSLRRVQDSVCISLALIGSSATWCRNYKDGPKDSLFMPMIGGAFSSLLQRRGCDLNSSYFLRLQLPATQVFNLGAVGLLIPAASTVSPAAGCLSLQQPWLDRRSYSCITASSSLKVCFLFTLHFQASGSRGYQPVRCAVQHCHPHVVPSFRILV